MAAKTQLWNKDKEPPPPNSLRKVNEPVGNKSSESKDPQAADKTEKKIETKLRIDAPEFVPAYMKQQTFAPHSAPTSSTRIQDRLKVHKHPQQNNTGGSGQSQAPSDGVNGGADEADMIRLRQIINTLTNDPGQFDNLLEIFFDTLAPYFKDVPTILNASELLVNQAISNQNFRYTGARLCYHLEQNCPLFRTQLHLACSKELEDGPNKQNVLLFVSELYTQLNHQNIYGNLVTDGLKLLLMAGGNDNIKCTCQALKLTGRNLEKYDSKALDDVFQQLEAAKSGVSGSALILLNSVIALRKENWGQASSNESTTSNEEYEEAFYYEEPQTVFYNADGQEFTNDEKQFLAAHMNSNDDYLTDGSDPDELCDPEPEMDEEIQAAFKEFVKLSKR